MPTSRYPHQSSDSARLFIGAEHGTGYWLSEELLVMKNQTSANNNLLDYVSSLPWTMPDLNVNGLC